MSVSIIKQPNNRYALYGHNTDWFYKLNLTRDQALQEYISCQMEAYLDDMLAYAFKVAAKADHSSLTFSYYARRVGELHGNAHADKVTDLANSNDTELDNYANNPPS